MTAKSAANYGTWIAASDAMNGGKSTSAMQIAAPGAENSKGALQVTGEVVRGWSVSICWRALLCPVLRPPIP